MLQYMASLDFDEKCSIFMPKSGGSLILGRQPGEFVDPDRAADVGISMDFHVKLHAILRRPFKTKAVYERAVSQ